MARFIILASTILVLGSLLVQGENVENAGNAQATARYGMKGFFGKWGQAESGRKSIHVSNDGRKKKGGGGRKRRKGSKGAGGGRKRRKGGKGAGGNGRRKRRGAKGSGGGRRRGGKKGGRHGKGKVSNTFTSKNSNGWGVAKA